MKETHDAAESRAKPSARPWKRIVLAFLALLALAIVGTGAWLLMPPERVAVTELLPADPFAYVVVKLDKGDPALKEIVAVLKSRLGEGKGFLQRELIGLLLPSALPPSVSLVVSADPGSGGARILAYADMGRLARAMRLGGSSLGKALLRGGPIVVERVGSQAIRSRSGAKGKMSFSAYAIVGGTLVLGTSREALLDSLSRYSGKNGAVAARTAFGDSLAGALEARDASLSVDNATGVVSRLVGAASAKYSFAAFPAIDSVSSISGSFQLRTEAIDGTLSFASASPAQVEGIRSDVQFIYGALKRVARSSGIKLQGEIEALEGAVRFHFLVPGYLEALKASSKK